MPKCSADEDVAVLNEENHKNGSGEEMDQDDNRRKKKKSKKVKVMGDSGQTNADRRILRRKQRELHQNIATGSGVAAAADEGDEDNEVNRLRDANNELWGDVRFTREAVLDSENVDLIANKAARQAEKLVQVPRYDAIRLAQGFVKKGTVRGQFNWAGLGFQTGVCFSSLPSNVSFLYGPLDAEYTPKERKTVERRKKQTVQSDDEAEEEQPEDVEQKDKKNSDGNELSAVEKHMKVISRTLEKKCKDANVEAKERAEEFKSQIAVKMDDEQVKTETRRFVNENSNLSAVETLFNPQSFTQTVENIFHFSFLVKNGDAGIRARSAEAAAAYRAPPGPVIRPQNPPMKDDSPKKRKAEGFSTQAVMALNMKDWRDLCQAYEVDESHVAHRVNGKVALKKKKKKRQKSTEA